MDVLSFSELGLVVAQTSRNGDSADWINPIISGAAGVAGAIIGAAAVLRSAREERRASELERRKASQKAEHDELRSGLANYLDATDRLVDTIAEIPPTGRQVKFLRRIHPIGLLFGQRALTLLAEEQFASVSRRFQDVGDNFYAARASLRLVAPAEVVDLMAEVDDLLPHRLWRHLGWSILPEYQQIRERFVAESRRIAVQSPS